MDEDLVVWDDSYSVDFKPIDDQHRELVAMINELIEGCKKGNAAADNSFLQVLGKVVNYAKTHFADEEKHLSNVQYPELASQKKEHFNFLFEVVSVTNDVESGKTPPIDMAKFLKKWLMNHIIQSDKLYMSYLKKSVNPFR